MPKKAKEMSAIEVKRLNHSGSGLNNTVAVGGVPGLLMQITKTGSKGWLLRTKVGKNRREIGLGGYPEIPLAQARDKARDARELIRSGVDPVERRKEARAALIAQQRTFTFKEAMEAFLVIKLVEFDNIKHKKQWRATLDKYAVPYLGDMPVGDITVQDIVRCLSEIWTEKTETASRLRGRIEAVLSWATVNGHRTGDNPARWRGNLDATLAKPAKLATVRHHPALSLSDAADWFTDLRGRSGTATRALELMAMTAARSGEIRGARWDELDRENALWVIGAERMKAGKEHRVALTDEALALINAMPRFEGSPYIFAAPRGGQLSDASLSACMKRISTARAGGYVDTRSNRPAVPHGVRSTFRDWCSEKTEYPSDMAEISLAHQVGSMVERAYRRGDMIEKRRLMMVEWLRFLKGHEAGANVVKLEARF